MVFAKSAWIDPYVPWYSAGMWTPGSFTLGAFQLAR